jgi:hypothetical protein
MSNKYRNCDDEQLGPLTHSLEDGELVTRLRSIHICFATAPDIGENIL